MKEFILPNEYMTPKNQAGLWFAIGAFFVAAIETYQMYSPAAYVTVIVFILLSCPIIAFYFGRSWGPLILQLEHNNKSIFLAFCYGLIIGVCTLFWLIFFRMIIDPDFIAKLFQSIQIKAYANTFFYLLTLPFYSLFATIIGTIITPLVPIASGCGGIILYLIQPSSPN